MGYLLPTTVESALAGLAGGRSTVVAGATDYYPSLGPSATSSDIVDISAVDELRAISNNGDQWRIGALAT
ncbi:MAG: xanthine dehydrogenase family protein subunit M, partial [Actinobacteria bacterium]|nr:xanthine dehydrogenase family protein subunit M [Actinomycetota bacterium]